MDLTNKTVKHFLFGEGTVQKMDGNTLLVEFSQPTGQKTFLYPSAFTGYLTMNDESDQALVQADIEQCRQEEAHQRERRARIEAMKSHLLESRRNTRKTPARHKS